MNFIIEHLSKSFEKKQVLRDIDFTFENGKIYGLLGRNGAGKTTLFNCLNGDIKFDAGHFFFYEDGVSREAIPDDIGYVLSTPTVPEFMTGREFLKFFLDMERSDFQSEDVTLAGYKYSKANQEIKGVVIIAHGLGGGGHNTYMPFIDYFTSNGYYVFAYDARGNDNSGGDAVEGLPQGIICLDNALHHVVAIEEYKDLPIALFGHSWGGYSVGNVLNMHPDIKAAVIIAGFNESEDLLEYQGQQMADAGVHILMPYLKLYERIKFGKEFTSVSALQGLEKTNAGIMVVHSKDDATVPTKYGYDKFYEAFGNSDRFEFVLYEDKGHDYLFYSEAAWAYREQLNADYKSYVEDNGREYSAETKEEFMSGYLDKKQCFEPDPVLMEQILNMFDEHCTSN